ncbi:MAG: hypothetical protein Tsb002_19530 [Wenzhouxiangellaceae bacterium]
MTNRILGILLLLAGLPLLASAHHDEQQTQEAIDFTLPLLAGDPVSLSDYRGQWVVVNYWATWCGPCRKEIPDLSQLHDDRDDITVLGLAYEEVDAEVFEKFLTEYQATYPILVVDVYDPPAALGTPRALPTTFIVDPRGAIAKTILGPVTSEDISHFIAEHG